MGVGEENARDIVRRDAQFAEDFVRSYVQKGGK